MSGLQLRINLALTDSFSLRLDIEMPERGVSAFYGPSGSGKTTLLNCIAGLQVAGKSDHIQFRDQVWQAPGVCKPAHQRRIGFVFQDARLFPHLNVRQNLEYALKRRRESSPIAIAQVSQWLQLEGLMEQASSALSAGQAQRVAIARALLSAPQLLLFDEPLANLDQAARAQCIECLQNIRDQLEIPMLYVSHDIEEVAQLAEHVVVLHEGAVEDQGSLLELSSRLQSQLSQGEQAAAIALATVIRHDREFGLTELDFEGETLYVNHLNEKCGQVRRLRIPARDVSVCRERPHSTSILNILPVTLCEIQQSDGARVLLRLQLGNQYLLARVTCKSASQLQLRVGDALFAQIKSAALLSHTSDSP